MRIKKTQRCHAAETSETSARNLARDFPATHRRGDIRFRGEDIRKKRRTHPEGEGIDTSKNKPAINTFVCLKRCSFVTIRTHLRTALPPMSAPVINLHHLVDIRSTSAIWPFLANSTISRLSSSIQHIRVMLFAIGMPKRASRKVERS